MDIIRSSELIETPWKNGGGVMWEIAGASLNGKSMCRLSLADVTRNGPFSDYAGQIRILTVIKGEGMVLESNECTLHAKPFSPVRFSGALKIQARLYAGASTNLNLMFNPAHCDCKVTILHGPCQQTLNPVSDQIFALHGLAGTSTFSLNARLDPDDTALINSNSHQITLADNAAALLVTICPERQSDIQLTRV